ncbi:hypothetical protein MNEG_11722 [Monoraphidium neglectum]|uniref:Uncharacterized protein n=1 Tax=Monoraphidium neglectum TaxID=145388 RepID=A0A0D2J934_9CHLO|nr:hypothetical protein MNEG_11722 [Monoraphidium neglectum]KIY96242.1 hypothetical protein MNEG_11722 [Monoraphidium neglectum]|eukprot:XP_013895262.1 hypothetical protein MNEG_11722 [Monoraphidium neglectum]
MQRRSRSWGPRAAATVKVLLAWGADPTARANGQTPFEMTPNHPTCKPLPKDHRFTIQDCQEVCKVLRDGLPAAEKAAIKAGKLLDDGSRDLPKCCANRTSTNITLTQCCF